MSNYTSSSPVDTTADAITATDGAFIMSAYFGLDNAFPSVGLLDTICGTSLGNLDGMPLVLSREIDATTLDAGDFLINNETVPVCVSLLPAVSTGELRTVLLMGEFNNNQTHVDSVCITGNLFDICNTITFKGSCITPLPLSATPELVLAEIIPKDQRDDLADATCGKPIRTVWNGGVTTSGTGKEAKQSYQVTLQDGTVVSPTSMLDVVAPPTDNNHVLCFEDNTTGGVSSSDWASDNMPVTVTAAAGLWQDPNQDGTNMETMTDVIIPTPCPGVTTTDDGGAKNTTTITSAAAIGVGGTNVWMLMMAAIWVMWR